MASKANSIYEEFIQCDAPKEVTAQTTLEHLLQISTNKSFDFIVADSLWSQINLDFHTKNVIAQCLREPTATSFQAAQRKVYSLMENNSYPRFIHSDLYKELCAVARGEGKHIKS